MDIEQLLQKSRQGDKDAYRLVVRALGPSVRSFLASRLNDFHAIEDLSQEVFISAYKSLDKFSGQGSFQSWLLSISRNKAADHLRRQYSQKNLKAAYEVEIQNLLSKNDDTLQQVTGERINKLQSCIQKLPEEARTLILKRYFNNETVISLAERLESSENAISSRLFRLKKKLRNCIETL